MAASAPRYLILTHVAAQATDRPGTLAMPEAFLVALRVQVAALKTAGFDVSLALPVRPHGPATDGHAAVTSGELGISLVALPAYHTMAQYLAARGALRRTVTAAAQEAAVVQAGVSGHPVAMAQAVWDSLVATAAKRMLLFGEDPFPARANYAASGRNPAKRYGKTIALQRLGAFCQSAITEAAATIAHSPAVAARFAAVWKGHCHVLAPGLIRDSELVETKAVASARTLRVVCVGREQATSGVDHVIRAVAKARRLSAAVELDLVGDVTGSSELMNLIRDAGLEPAVRLHGHLNDVRLRAVLDGADVLMWPALVPVVDKLIYGAAARGLPIVTYAGGLADVAIVARGAGNVVPRGESTLVAEVLLRLSRNREKVRDLAVGALAWARESTLEAVHRRRAAVAWEVCGGS
jgi:glycosyltransferase involved in cell wall biosynthesis